MQPRIWEYHNVSVACDTNVFRSQISFHNEFKLTIAFWLQGPTHSSQLHAQQTNFVHVGFDTLKYFSLVA